MTPADLEQLPDRELDALVAEVVKGIEARVPKRCFHTGATHHEEMVIRGDLPFYSTSWTGYGLVVERMHELSWTYDVDATAPELGIDVCFHPKNLAFHVKGSAETPFRAVAIAAVLAFRATNR